MKRNFIKTGLKLCGEQYPSSCWGQSPALDAIKVLKIIKQGLCSQNVWVTEWCLLIHMAGFHIVQHECKVWGYCWQWMVQFTPNLLDLQCFLMHSPSHHALSPSAPEFVFFIVSIFHKVFLFINFIPELINCLSEFSCILLSFFMTEILNSPSFRSRSVSPWLCVWLLENCLFLLPWWFMVLDVLFLCSEQLYGLFWF